MTVRVLNLDETCVELQPIPDDATPARVTLVLGAGPLAVFELIGVAVSRSRWSEFAASRSAIW